MGRDGSGPARASDGRGPLPAKDPTRIQICSTLAWLPTRWTSSNKDIQGDTGQRANRGVRQGMGHAAQAHPAPSPTSSLLRHLRCTPWHSRPVSPPWAALGDLELFVEQVKSLEAPHGTRPVQPGTLTAPWRPWQGCLLAAPASHLRIRTDNLYPATGSIKGTQPDGGSASRRLDRLFLGAATKLPDHTDQGRCGHFGGGTEELR